MKILRVDKNNILNFDRITGIFIESEHDDRGLPIYVAYAAMDQTRYEIIRDYNDNFVRDYIEHMIAAANAGTPFNYPRYY